MKKKRCNVLLSLLLVASLVMGQPAMAFAAETSDPSLNEDYDSTIMDDEEITEEAVEDSEDATETETIGDEQDASEEAPVDETDSAADNNDDQQTEDEQDAVPSDQEANSDEEETSPVDDETDTNVAEPVGGALNVALSAENAAMMDELGFKTMALTSEMVAEKEELATVASEMTTMKSGDDYIENEIVYLADSEEEAEKIAECFGGTIINYNQGVAEVSIEQNVSDAIKVAADMNISIPAVYPNIVYTLFDEEFIDFTDEELEKATGSEEEPEEVPETEDDTIFTVKGGEHVYALNPTDAKFSKQWHHKVVNTVEAWGNGNDSSMGAGVLVAVIDTGIDPTHPDLDDNIEDYVSVYVGDDGKDQNGHGTHCAGIIAAEKNDSYGVGIAPKAKIFSVKVLASNGRGGTAAFLMGIRTAAAKKVDIMSMSLGSWYYDALVQKEIDKATQNGIVVVAAAGNDYTNQKSYPAAYNNVIAVASVDNSISYNHYINGRQHDVYNLSWFSNYGSWVDIAAPGGSIYSTYPMNLGPSAGIDWVETGFVGMSGTSMACPVVAGTIALMLGNNSSLKNTDTKAGAAKITKTLLDSAETYGGYKSSPEYRYYSLVDAEAAAYAVIDSAPEMPTVKFNGKEPNAKGVVTAEFGEPIMFQTTTDHGKIYFTVNGKKPTAKTGARYYNGQTVEIYASGKVKIQAVTVLGNKTSKVFSKTYTFDVKPKSLSSTYGNIKDDITVAIGKSIQLSVDVYPSAACNKKLEWSSSDATGMIKVNKSNGKVTCSKKAAHGTKATITAKTKDVNKDGKQLEYTFTVTAVNEQVGDLTLNKNAINMSYCADDMVMKDATGARYVSSFKLEPSSGAITTKQYLYKSSNTKVATVDANGVIRAWAKGKAKITVTANDGSGKKAVCNVTVVTPVFDITAYSNTGFGDGQEIPIATGCTITMKTYVNYNSKYAPEIPSNKKLNWSAGGSGLTAKNGKVKCDRNATIGAKVPVTVSAADNFGTSITIYFRIVDKIEKFYFVDEKGNRLTNPKLDRYVEYYDIAPYRSGLGIQTMHGTKNYYDEIVTSTSNKDVIYEYYEPLVGEWIIAMTKPGTSKFTITARDGSNTKITFTYKVKAKELDFTGLK